MLPVRGHFENKRKTPRMKDSKYYLIFVIFLITSSCTNHGKDPLTSAFSEHELKEIDKIVEFYDNHVNENTSSSLPIDKAYKQFIEQNRSNDSISENEDTFFIESEERNKLFNSIDPEFIKEIYELSDSARYSDLRTRERYVVYPPYLTNLNRYGKFTAMIKKMSLNNKFYLKTYSEIMACGDICPTTIARLIHHCDSIDFSQKSERFVFAVSFLNSETDIGRYRKNAP
jgi:hypothetical protein